MDHDEHAKIFLESCEEHPEWGNKPEHFLEAAKVHAILELAESLRAPNSSDSEFLHIVRDIQEQIRHKTAPPMPQPPARHHYPYQPDGLPPMPPEVIS